jgi:hypothetical protein
LLSGITFHPVTSTCSSSSVSSTNCLSLLGDTNPTIKEIQSWSPLTLLNWIQEKLKPTPLESDDAQKFLNAKIDGRAFHYAGSRELPERIFEGAGIFLGPSLKLAQLAKSIGDAEKTSKFYLINTTQAASR